MGLFYRRNRRMLDLRQRRRDYPEQHHIRTSNKMRDLDDTLDFDLRIDRSDPSGRILPVIHYFIRERPDQTATDDSQSSTLRIVHPLGHS